MIIRAAVLARVRDGRDDRDRPEASSRFVAASACAPLPCAPTLRTRCVADSGADRADRGADCVVDGSSKRYFPPRPLGPRVVDRRQPGRGLRRGERQLAAAR